MDNPFADCYHIDESAENMQDYTDIFGQRGSVYDRAMLAYPDARHAEFAQVIAALAPYAGMVIGDVPAGGGYLRSHLPAECVWMGHEPCSDFKNQTSRPLAGGEKAFGRGAPLLPLPWYDGELDALVSIAGLHHIEDKLTLFREAARVVRPNGRLVASDVAEGSAPAAFLDGFVGDWNSTGHKGLFLNEQTKRELTEAGWVIRACQMNKYCWSFPSREAMVDFTRSLFDISGVNDANIEAAIANKLGIVDLPGGGVGMNWSLLTITCGHATAL